MKVKEKTYNRIEMYNQMEILRKRDHEFFCLGDSGSLVLQMNPRTSELDAIGLGIGVTSYGAGIATPLPAVLGSFGIQMNMMKFEKQSVVRNKRSPAQAPFAQAQFAQPMDIDISEQEQLHLKDTGYMSVHLPPLTAPMSGVHFPGSSLISKFRNTQPGEKISASIGQIQIDTGLVLYYDEDTNVSIYYSNGSVAENKPSGKGNGKRILKSNDTESELLRGVEFVIRSSNGTRIITK